MQIHLSPRHLRLTGAIHSYVAEKIAQLEEITERIMAAHVVLYHDDKANPKQAYCVKVHLAIPGPDLHAQDFDADLYAAIDKVTSKVARQLRKRKTKLVDKRKAKYQREKERTRRAS